MKGRNILTLILAVTLIACFSSHAFSFSTGDLAGTWYAHHVAAGDAPVDDPRWGYRTVIIDSAGNFTATSTSPTQTNEVSTGTVQISSIGVISVNNSPLVHGVMNDDKNLIVFIDGTVENKGNGLTVMIKRSKAAGFSASDFAGTWYGYQVVSGDAPADDPRWGYGTVEMGSSGNYTATWASPTQSNEVTTGSIQTNSEGIFTINNQPLTHGVISDDTNLMVFVDGTNDNHGNALTVMIKRSAAAGFSKEDFAGTWYGHHVVSGDAPADDPRWGYGTVEINGSGDFTVSWTSPTRADQVSTGTIQINSMGLITIGNQMLINGAMNDAKDLIVFIDGTDETQGNALNIMMKRSKAVLAGQNLLLLK